MSMGKLAIQAFIGAKILETGPTPVPDEFSFQCITGEHDRKNNCWFGLVLVMRDPQMWANKMLSNALHIANTTAKGGIIAEKDAFDDQREAEDTYAQPNAITWASANAVKDQRIMPKPWARRRKRTQPSSRGRAVCRGTRTADRIKYHDSRKLSRIASAPRSG